MSNGNTTLTDGERLIRIELLLERVEARLGETVSRAECAAKHPAKEPWPQRLRTWLQIIVLVGAILAGYLAFHGMESRLDAMAPPPVQQGPDGGR